MGADLYIDKLPSDSKNGYFRDSYNSANLLWQFDLSYWSDIAVCYCDRSGVLTVKRAQHLLDLLEIRKPIFESNLEKLLKHTNPVWDKEPTRESLSDTDRVKWVKYYRKHYRLLRAFLKRAIALKSRISCSL